MQKRVVDLQLGRHRRQSPLVNNFPDPGKDIRRLPQATAENDDRGVQQADGRCQDVSYFTAPLMQRGYDFGLTVSCLDMLYNNASTPKFAPFAQMGDEDYLFTIRNELDLVWHACQKRLAAPGRRRRCDRQHRFGCGDPIA